MGLCILLKQASSLNPLILNWLTNSFFIDANKNGELNTPVSIEAVKLRGLTMKAE